MQGIGLKIESQDEQVGVKLLGQRSKQGETDKSKGANAGRQKSRNRQRS